MAQDGNWQADPTNEQKLRAQVEQSLGRLNPEKNARYQREDEREAKVRRQHSLEQAAGIVKAVTTDTTINTEAASAATLTMADKFSRWVETGTLS